jgi:hypothetical protein
LARSIAAEGFYFLLDQKVTKNQVGKKASLPHRPLPCKPCRTTGWNLLPYCRSLHSPALLQNFLCPCHAQGHHRSARFRPKLFFRRGGEENPVNLINPLHPGSDTKSTHHCEVRSNLLTMHNRPACPIAYREIASYLAMTSGKVRCLYLVKDAKYRVSMGYDNVETRYFASPAMPFPALGIAADTGLVANACARMSVKPGPKVTPLSVQSKQSVKSQIHSIKNQPPPPSQTLNFISKFSQLQ